MAHSRHQSNLWSHSQEDVVQVVNRFRQASPPATLVSPAVTSGWDFPEDECRYIIIGKIPFGDGRSPVNKARKADDPKFGYFEAMQTIVQEAGRGTRSRSASFVVSLRRTLPYIAKSTGAVITILWRG